MDKRLGEEDGLQKEEENRPMYKKKKYVIVGARVHPGESNSSYMMQGFIKYMLGDSH